jgi:Rps23 Pro-64 3,4-dihydroxylase Tpa1-like proline 4-hydroxylase
MFNTILDYFKSKPFIKIENNVFSSEYLGKLKNEFLRSNLLTKNHLNYNFSTTKGFSIIFKKEEISTVKEKFPFIVDYLDKIVDPKSTAFYLNILVMELNSKVDKHIDHSLRSYYEKIDLPVSVTVLYVSIPKMLGGNLIFYDRENFIKEIKPKNNDLVVFAGHLKHEITEIFECEKNEQRISLICEQYILNQNLLSKVPSFLIKSTANFESFLINEME